jgi:tRNA1(Val) A37 N6-methylase TrmN6
VKSRPSRESSTSATAPADLSGHLPEALKRLPDPQRDIPAIAKDRALTSAIEAALRGVPTHHRLLHTDARKIESFLPPDTVHLVITSPPYWTLKEYRRENGQLGYISDYEEFLAELDKVWNGCFKALVPGGRLVCVVGDVCEIKVATRLFRSIPRFRSTVAASDSTTFLRSFGTKSPTLRTK